MNKKNCYYLAQRTSVRIDRGSIFYLSCMGNQVRILQHNFLSLASDSLASLYERNTSINTTDNF